MLAWNGMNQACAWFKHLGNIPKQRCCHYRLVIREACGLGCAYISAFLASHCISGLCALHVRAGGSSRGAKVREQLEPVRSIPLCADQNTQVDSFVRLLDVGDGARLQPASSGAPPEDKGCCTWACRTGRVVLSSLSFVWPTLRKANVGPLQQSRWIAL
jgi:hypothetical protein